MNYNWWYFNWKWITEFTSVALINRKMWLVHSIFLKCHTNSQIDTFIQYGNIEPIATYHRCKWKCDFYQYNIWKNIYGKFVKMQIVLQITQIHKNGTYSQNFILKFKSKSTQIVWLRFYFVILFYFRTKIPLKISGSFWCTRRSFFSPHLGIH